MAKFLALWELDTSKLPEKPLNPNASIYSIQTTLSSSQAMSVLLLRLSITMNSRNLRFYWNK
jgi:hypothetical protein